MLTRRDVMFTAALVAMLPAWEHAQADVPQSPLDKLFAQFVDEMLQRVPERATSLGLDVGARADLRGKLHEESLDAIKQDKKDTARRLAELRAIDRAKLTGLDVSSYDTVMFTLQVDDEAGRLFDYGTGSARSPYVLSQLTGAYQSVPDFLDTQHPLKTVTDAEDYLARIGDFARLMDQELEVFQHDASAGVVPPDFIIDKTLAQMNALLSAAPESSVIVTSITRRAAAASLPAQARYPARALSGYKALVLPALQRQADALRDARTHASREAGVERLPKGADFYRLGLKSYTTSSMPPAEIHKTGLELVTSLSADIDTALQKQGMKDGSVGQRLAALAADKRYVYDDTDEGKDKLIADLNKKVAVMQGKLPERFDTLPKVTVQIRRVPKAIEAGAPGGYYQRGALDGSRPGAYYINLRDTAEWPSWSLADADLPRGDPWASPADLAGAGDARPAADPQDGGLLRLRGGLGAVRGTARRRNGHVRRRFAGAYRTAAGLAVPRGAAGGGFRHPRDGLEPRQGGGLLRGHARRETHRRGDRGGALLRVAGPGVQLHDRQAGVAAAARAGQGGAGGEVRHQEVS